MPSYINSVTTRHARIKDHLQFVKKYIKRLIFVISIPNNPIKQSISEKGTWAQQTEWNKEIYVSDCKLASKKLLGHLWDYVNRKYALSI